MKNFRMFGLLLIAVSAHAAEIDLRPGSSVKINVSGCEQYQEKALSLRGSTVAASCAPVMCQVEHDRGDLYQVYRFQGDDCVWNGCNERAKLVGQFSVPPSILFYHSVSGLKEGMKKFISNTQQCGALRLFVSGVYKGGQGFLTIKRE